MLKKLYLRENFVHFISEICLLYLVFKISNFFNVKCIAATYKFMYAITIKMDGRCLYNLFKVL